MRLIYYFALYLSDLYGPSCSSKTLYLTIFLSIGRHIPVANNTVTSTIPSEIGQLKKLTQLDLKNNTFVGTIPTQIGLMTSLITLDLRKLLPVNT